MAATVKLLIIDLILRVMTLPFWILQRRNQNENFYFCALKLFRGTLMIIKLPLELDSITFGLVNVNKTNVNG